MREAPLRRLSFLQAVVSAGSCFIALHHGAANAESASQLQSGWGRAMMRQTIDKTGAAKWDLARRETTTPAGT
jgi:hypothetical protein